MCNGICSRKCDSRPAVSHACAISDVTLSMLITCMCLHSIGTVHGGSCACANHIIVTLRMLVTVLGHQAWQITCMCQSHNCDTAHAGHLHVSSQYWDTKHGRLCACVNHIIVTLRKLITCMFHHSTGTVCIVENVHVPSHLQHTVIESKDGMCCLSLHCFPTSVAKM